MTKTPFKHSKTSIDKAGNFLKSKTEGDLSSPLAILSDWRTYHVQPLEAFANTLRKRVKKISLSSNVVVAQRLKRTQSIIMKLQKHPTMRLSTMQDIGGLRAVLETMDEVKALVDLYRTSKTKHTLFSVNDYMAGPKPDGYRSIHLIYKVETTAQVFIEIQIRTHLQHIWATAVEVFGTLKQSSFKTGIGEARWLELFSMLSEVFVVKEVEQSPPLRTDASKERLLKKLKKSIKDLRAIEQLSVYTSAYKIISQHQRTPGRSGHYSLIILNSKDSTIEVKTFGAEQMEQATDLYLEHEKQFFQDSDINVVLVNTGNVKKLEAGYPNYFMDTKILVQYLSKIMLDEFI